MQRKSPPAKRPTRPSLTDRGLVAKGDAAPAADTAVKPDVEGFLREFEAGLKDQPDLSEQDRELIQREFAAALRAAAEQGDDAGSEAPNWAETIRLLEQDGVLDNSQHGDLIRQLEAAMQPLQEPDVQLAIEFGKRCRKDGKDKALEWYRAQTGAEQKNASPMPPERDTPRPKTSEVKSRARKVRGPPAGY